VLAVGADKLIRSFSICQSDPLQLSQQANHVDIVT
jgi:hypothetical protein